MPAIELVSALPTFTSHEEHQKLVASTPESFKDIPPVLHHQEENVAVRFDPAVEQFSPEDLANGSLYVIER
jgi:chloride channel, nucleotide-sensitive, 1A